MLKLYQWSRKIHRYLVLIITVLIVIMAWTGTLLKYPQAAVWFGSPDLGWVRYLHNQLSPFLTIVLVFMALSGLVMYFYPMYTQRRAKKNQPVIES